MTWSTLFVGLVAAACSGGSSGGNNTVPVTADQACGDVANALCNQASTCSPIFMQTVYGDVATCVTRTKQSCAHNLAAPGTTDTPDVVEGCSKAYAKLACADVLGSGINPPAECRPKPGTVANGGACGVDEQCQSTACKVDATTGCGTCVTRASAGQSCAKGIPCDYGVVCAGTAGSELCVAPATSGSACDANKPCMAGLVCDGGTCKTPQPVGAACTGVGIGNCNGAQGLFCSQGKCTQLLTASSSQPCGYDSQSGSFTLCLASSACVGSPTTCSAVAPDGAACDATKGPSCLAPARCLSGTCTVVDPASCK